MKGINLKIIIGLITFAVIGLIAVQFYWISNAFNIERDKFKRQVNEALVRVAELIDKNETADILIKTLNRKGKRQIFVFNKADTDITLRNTDSSSNNIIINKNIVIGNQRSKFKYNFHASDSNDNDQNEKIESTVTIDSLGQKTVNVKWISKSDTFLTSKKRIVEDVLDELIESKRPNSFEERIDSSHIFSLLKREFANREITNKFYFNVKRSKDSKFLFSSNKSVRSVPPSDIYSTLLFPDNIFSEHNYLLVYFPNRSTIIMKRIFFMLLVSIIVILLIIFLFFKIITILINQKRIGEIKDDLINNITHEFKTPLSTIALAIENLNQSSISGDGNIVSKYLDIIKNESNRLKFLVENLLNTANYEKQGIQLNRKNTDIHIIIDQAISNSQLLLNEKHCRIHKNFTAQKKVVSVDPFHFSNAISNLIDNALKYNSKQPEIFIETEDTLNKLIIKIKDNGIGIIKKDQKKIFETFFRVPTGNIHEVNGHGIGLSYVKKIIDSHSGEIYVKSKISEGTEFTIKLPHYERK